VRARRITLLVVLGLLAAGLVASGSSRDEEAVPGAVASPGPAAPTTALELPADDPVRARAGEVVRLRVRAERPGEARILALGLDWPVGPGLPGEVVFVAPGPGELPVVLRGERGRLGVVEVR
jgi:hypothetical protein